MNKVHKSIVLLIIVLFLHEYAFGDNIIALNQEIIAEEDIPVDIELKAENVIGEELSYTIVNQPLHGILRGSPPLVRYIPELDYYGLDSFTFKAMSKDVSSNIAEIKIYISQVIDPPIAYDQHIVIIENSSTAITLTGNSVDGDKIEFEITEFPINGELTGDIPYLLYKPNKNYVGSDYFEFISKTQYLASNIGTISINITSKGDLIKQDNEDSNCFIMIIITDYY